MMDKRLLSIVPESKKYIAGNVVLQWLALCGNIVMMAAIAQLLSALYGKTATGATLLRTLLIAACVMVLRYFCTVGSAKCGYFSAKQVKKTLRTLIFEKLLRLGPAYRDSVNTSEVVQVSVEGVDQLDRRLTQEEYDRVVDHVMALGLEDGFVQELSSSDEKYIPSFDLTGVNRL